MKTSKKYRINIEKTSNKKTTKNTKNRNPHQPKTARNPHNYKRRPAPSLRIRFTKFKSLTINVLLNHTLHAILKQPDHIRFGRFLQRLHGGYLPPETILPSFTKFANQSLKRGFPTFLFPIRNVTSFF